MQDRDPLMHEIVRRFEQSGMTLAELGAKMNLTGPSTRKAAWRFLYLSKDPKVSTVRRFCRTLRISLSTLAKSADRAGSR